MHSIQHGTWVYTCAEQICTTLPSTSAADAVTACVTACAIAGVTAGMTAACFGALWLPSSCAACICQGIIVPQPGTLRPWQGPHGCDHHAAAAYL